MAAMKDLYPECYALCERANDAAQRMQALWFSFLIFGTFIAVAVGGTTHRMLFLETQISLPVFSISIPLLGFYYVAPALFVIFHIFLIAKLLLVQEAYEDFKKQVARDIPLASERRQMAQHVNLTVFLQSLRRRGQPEGTLGFLIHLVIFATLAAAPVALLLLAQIMFLPYHSDGATWTHRFLVFADLALLLWAAESTLRDRGLSLRRLWGRRIVFGATAAAVFLFSLTIATFPKGGMDNNVLAMALMDGVGWEAEKLRGFAGVRKGLLGEAQGVGWKNELNGLQTTSAHDVFPTVLQLSNEGFAGKLNIDLEKIENTVNLRGRDLVGANLRDTDLRKALFDDADLSYAQLFRARLQGASLFSTEFRNVSLRQAQLHGANLDEANLQDASLEFAQLQGASLKHAQFQGANLDEAMLQGAKMNFANFQGATLSSARLQGAHLLFTQFQGADLYQAEFQGVNMFSAQFQGASLKEAHLEGLDLAGMSLQGSSLRKVHLWRSHNVPEVDDIATIEVSDINLEPSLDKMSNSISIAYKNLRERAIAGVKDEKTRLWILDRISSLDPNPGLGTLGSKAANNWLVGKSDWEDVITKRRYEGENLGKSASYISEKACQRYGAPYVIRGLIKNGRIRDMGVEAARFGALFRDIKNCPGAKGLTQDDLSQLGGIIKTAVGATND